MKKIVLFICALISIYSCNTKKKETDLNKMGLKGDVIFVMPETWSFSDRILEFDNNGNLIRKINYFDYQNEITLTETSFIRDSSNKLIGENELMYTDKNDRQFYAVRKKYSYNNGILSTITYQNKYYNLIEKYKYEDDKLVEMKKESHTKTKEQESSLETTTYFYSKNNDLDSTIEVRLDENGELELKNLKVYLQNGLLKSEKNYYKFYDNTSSLTLRELIYNDKNDIIEEKLTDLKENKIYSDKYTYIYDDKNNWIEKTKKYSDSKNKDEVVKRRIFYKGENYSEFIAKYDLFILKYKSSSLELDGSSSRLEDESSSFSDSQIQDYENNSINSNQDNTSSDDMKQWVNCSHCHGTGIRECTTCYGKGKMQCGNCNGTGIWGYNNTRCVGCGGKGEVRCDNCYGKGNKGNCGYCYGKGQILE